MARRDERGDRPPSIHISYVPFGKNGRRGPSWRRPMRPVIALKVHAVAGDGGGEKKKTGLSLKASHEEGDGATLCWTLGGRGRGLKWSLLARALAWRHRRSDPETRRSLQQKIRPPAQRRTHLTASNFENRLSLCLLHGVPMGRRSLPWIRSDTQSRRLCCRAPLKRLQPVQIAGEPQNHLHRTSNVLLSAICSLQRSQKTCET